MKVLHIAPTPFFANRGCHIRIRNEIEGLIKEDVSVILCTYGLGNDVEHIDIRRIVSIPGYTQTKAGFSPFKILADIFLFFLVLVTAWQEKPDVLHGHLHEGALIGWAVKMVLFWRRLPLLMDMQGSLSGELAAYGMFRSFPFVLHFFYFIEKRICHFPQRILCSSQKSVEFLIEKCGVQKERIELLEDVVPDAFFSTGYSATKLKKFHALPTDKTFVIYTGSFLAGKGIDKLLDASRILLSRENDLFFIFVGYPRELVETFVTENKYEDSAVVVGEVPYDELPLWLSLADLAVDPKEEGSGEASGKIIHYMACGVPVVCFETTNNRKYLGENAFFVRQVTAADLAATIKEGAENVRQAALYGKAGRKKAELDYSSHSAAKKLIHSYNNCLEGMSDSKV